MAVCNDSSVPLPSISMGYALCFVPRSAACGPAALQACLTSLKEATFSGCSEFCVREDLPTGYYLLGLGVKNAEGHLVPASDWWKSFAGGVRRNCGPQVELHPRHSEEARVWALRDSFVHLGVLVCALGMPIAFSAEPTCTWFAEECQAFVAAHGTAAP